MARASLAEAVRVAPGCDHHHVLRREQVEEAGEQAAVAEGVAGQVGGEGLRDGVGAVEIGLLAREQIERHQVGDHDRVGVGRGVVVGAAHAHDDVGRVVGGEGVAAGVGDPVVRVEHGAPSARRRRDRPASLVAW